MTEDTMFDIEARMKELVSQIEMPKKAIVMHKDLRAKLSEMEEEDDVASREFKALPLRVARITEGEVEDDDMEKMKVKDYEFPEILVSGEVKRKVDAKTPSGEETFPSGAVVSEGNGTKGTGKRVERLVELQEVARRVESSIQRLNGLAEGDTRAGLITKAAKDEEPLAQKGKQCKMEKAALIAAAHKCWNDEVKQFKKTKAETKRVEDSIDELHAALARKHKDLEAMKEREAQHEKNLDEVLSMYSDGYFKMQETASEVKAKTENSHAFITELQVKIDELTTERGAQHAALVKVAQDVEEAFHAEHTTIKDNLENYRTIFQEWDTFQKTRKSDAFKLATEPVNRLAAIRSTTMSVLSCYCDELEQEVAKLCDEVAKSQLVELKYPVYDL